MLKRKIKLSKREAQLVVLLIQNSIPTNPASSNPTKAGEGELLCKLYWAVLLELEQKLQNYNWKTDRKAIAFESRFIFAMLQLLESNKANSAFDFITGTELYNKILRVQQQPILKNNNLFT